MLEPFGDQIGWTVTAFQLNFWAAYTKKDVQTKNRSLMQIHFQEIEGLIFSFDIIICIWRRMNRQKNWRSFRHPHTLTLMHTHVKNWLAYEADVQRTVCYLFYWTTTPNDEQSAKKNWRSNLSLSDCQICVYLLLLVCLYVFSSAVLCRQCLKHANENAQWWKHTASTSAHIP